MAITKIHPIKSTLNLAIDYIVNGDKTDEQLLVSTHKCHESTAPTQFLRTRNDAGTKGTVLARHLIQSFYREKQVLNWLTRLVWSCVKDTQR